MSSALAGFVQGALLSVALHNRSALGARVRARAYRTRCLVDTGVVVVNPDNFHADPESALYHACYILNPHGSVRLGRNSHLGAFCFVNACYGSVEIGTGVAIGPRTSIFSYSNHYARGRKIIEEHVTSDVSVGNNVFIGAHCVVLPGSSIGSNVVVGAGSVVRGNLPSNGIYAGTPARSIKSGWYG